MQNTLLLPETTASNPLAISSDIDFRHEKNMANIKRRNDFLADNLQEFENLSIYVEVEKIEQAYKQFKRVDKNLVEIRTRNWLNLGLMLIIHRKKVESAGHKWTEWVPEKLPFLKPRRRQMAEKLAENPSTAARFLYMGIDRLDEFFHKIQTYHHDPDFKIVTKRYGLFLKTPPETDEERAEKNKIADKIIEFFKFKGQTNNVSVNKDLLMDVIDSGVKFQKSAYEHVTKLAAANPTAADEYLLTALAIGSPPTTRTSTQPTASINIILARLIESVEGFQRNNIYPPIRRDIFQEARLKMNILARHI
jgi:hypothetical protein